jgi:predicted transcriptional regulator of viral defense system
MPQIEPRISTLFASSPVRRSRDFVSAGIPRIALTRAMSAGYLKRLARGIYCLNEYRQGEHGDLALVASKAPEAVICLLSALSYHGLTSQAPFQVWIALSSKAWAPRMEYPPLRITRFGGEALAYGVIVVQVEGVPVRVTTIAKTIADCFKYRNKVGLDVALEALREAHRGKQLDRDELWSCAKVDRVAKVILPYLEALA